MNTILFVMMLDKGASVISLQKTIERGGKGYVGLCPAVVLYPILSKHLVLFCPSCRFMVKQEGPARSNVGWRKHPMWVTEGEKIRSKIDSATYTVKTTFARSAVLESEDGRTQEWTNTSALNLFFEKIENQSD